MGKPLSGYTQYSSEHQQFNTHLPETCKPTFISNKYRENPRLGRGFEPRPVDRDWEVPTAPGPPLPKCQSFCKLP